MNALLAGVPGKSPRKCRRVLVSPLLGVRGNHERRLPLRGRALQSQDAVELLSDKWRITLLHLLIPGPQRAKTLQQAISKISPKVLTETLRGMERDGLISRKPYPNVPPRVEYQLTGMGAV